MNDDQNYECAPFWSPKYLRGVYHRDTYRHLRLSHGSPLLHSMMSKFLPGVVWSTAALVVVGDFDQRAVGWIEKFSVESPRSK